MNRIYGISAKERTDVGCLAPGRRFFELYDENNELRGSFYLDPYAREHKRGGRGWMTASADAQTRRLVAKPAAYLTRNFNRPVNG